MSFGLDPQESGDLRERARRLRYIAEGLSQAADKARVSQYADELEKRAAELEQEAARPTGPTVIVAAPVTHRSVNMSTVKVTATIEIEFEVRQELARPALARIPHDVAVRIEHGSIGSSMTGVVPGTAKVHLADKAIDGEPVP